MNSVWSSSHKFILLPSNRVDFCDTISRGSHGKRLSGVRIYLRAWYRYRSRHDSHVGRRSFIPLRQVVRDRNTFFPVARNNLTARETHCARTAEVFLPPYIIWYYYYNTHIRRNNNINNRQLYRRLIPTAQYCNIIYDQWTTTTISNNSDIVLTWRLSRSYNIIVSSYYFDGELRYVKSCSWF